jgi:hypothetical protein
VEAVATTTAPVAADAPGASLVVTAWVGAACVALGGVGVAAALQAATSTPTTATLAARLADPRKRLRITQDLHGKDERGATSRRDLSEWNHTTGFADRF